MRLWFRAQLLYTLIERFVTSIELATSIERRRWAYEIFSVFLMENSVCYAKAKQPLLLSLFSSLLI